MKPLTIFSWGYYGWGTPHLIKAVDAVEMGRGFKPPIFVDIRIRRSVRAAGFTGPTFEKLLGQNRHRWMKSLGNKFIETKTGPSIQIANPAAAEELLDLALDSAKSKQRLLFFCSCQWPRCEGHINCHRTTIGLLIVKAAEKLGVPVEVVEWPGGNPKRIDLEVVPKTFISVRNGRKSIPLETPVYLAELAGIPWASIATLHSGEEKLHRIVGPAISQTSGWLLPVFPTDADGIPEHESEASRLRQSLGLEPVSV